MKTMIMYPVRIRPLNAGSGRISRRHPLEPTAMCSILNSHKQLAAARSFNFSFQPGPSSGQQTQTEVIHMYNVIFYEVLTITDDVYRFTSEKRLSDDDIASKIGVSVDDLIQVDFWDVDDL